MEIGLFIIFWYGILHAFGPDHLTVIADFSIGKNVKKTTMITLFFALGHGLSLFIFASILQSFPALEVLTDYGDIISASVIILMGCYLLYIVLTDRILLNQHTHDGKPHIHISFSRKHSHRFSEMMPVLSLGVLMGIGGVRGMLVTLGLVNNQEVTLSVVAVFALGVMVVFLCFGWFVLTLNRDLLRSLISITRAFSLLGLTSIAVGGYIIWG
jgi:nickel/cobalt exporter